jgi:hypothetical protein
MINKKGLAKGIAKISLLVLITTVLGVFLVNYAIPALANTHTSVITVTPNIVPSGTSIDFTARVECTSTGGTADDEIHEVRIYEHFDFTNIDCKPTTGWYGPFPGENQYGKFCLWTAQAGYELGVGEYKDFQFSSDTPDSECCRTWLMETRDKNNYWIFNYPDICIDTTPPDTTKRFIGPQKISDGIEWIDGVTLVELTARDDVGPHDAGIDKTWYRNDWYTDEHLGSTGCYEPSSCTVGFYKEFFGLMSPYERENWQGCIDECQEDCEDLYWGDMKFDNWYDCVETCGAGPCDLPAAWKLYRGEPIQKDEESCHVLTYFSVDNVGNIEDMNINCFFVDKTPPEISKDNGRAIPDSGEFNFTTPWNKGGAFHWITTDMPILFDCVDPEPHPSGDEELCFRVSFNYPIFDYTKTQEYCSNYGGAYDKYGDEFCCVDVSGKADFDFYFLEETMHNLEYYCIDAVEKESCIHTQYYKVDDTPPVIEKYMFGDYLGDCPHGTDLEHGDCYVSDNGISGVEIEVEDGGEVCAVEGLSCYYELWWETSLESCIAEFEGTHLYNEQTGECFVEGGEFEYEKEILFHQDSTHRLYIYCEDALGNWVEDVEEFLVDSTPPVTEKIYGEPFVEDWYPKGCYEQCEDECTFCPTTTTLPLEDGCRVDEGCLEECLEHQCGWAEWINSSTSITLTAEDEKVGVHETYWRNTLVDDEFCEDPEEYCYCESPEEEEVFDLTGDVDGTVTKTDNGDSFTWTIVITSDNPAHHRWGVGMAFATSIDQPSFQVWYREYQEPYGWYYQDYGTGWNGAVTALPTEGITATGDHTGQTFTITVPKTKLGAPCGRFYWGAQARTNLLGKYPSTWNQWSGGSGEVSGMAISPLGGVGEWNVYTQPFYKPEESCHVIEYFSVDRLGNEEDVNWQCVFVDDTEPDVCKDIGEPKEPSGQEGVYFITGETPIDLYCADMDPHPVDHVSLWYRYRISEDCETWGEWTGWIDPTTNGNGNGGPCEYMYNNPYMVKKTIFFPEDSCHELEYYCEDALGNRGEIYGEIDIVDNQPPEIEKEIVGPSYGDCPPMSPKDDCYVDGVTEIHVDVWDPEPHPVNDVSCYYEVWWKTDLQSCIDEFQGTHLWNEQTEECFVEHTEFGEEGAVIVFGQDSTHNLYIYCEDALGNWVDDYETFLVDLIPPVTTKLYGQPYYENDGEWITSDTPITLNAEDEKSGVDVTYYRIELVDDTYCDGIDKEGDNLDCDDAVPRDSFFDVYTEIFTIPEESCHLIEYYSVDNVEKTEETKRQCVFVDNTPPLPVKEVGEPKGVWDGSDSYFYPEETAHCWDGTGEEIECWKVTMMTPIIMDCEDQDPHPVNHDHVCFMVDFDGDDITEDYCDYYGGDTEGNDGYCCMESEAPLEIHFGEESEHNLKYYCVDALGNEGPIDEEKFKVEGTSFEIPLYKKWNLISVPFVLLNDDPDEVFKDTPGVVSVWAYDPEHVLCGFDWCVYTNDDTENDNLERILPGWGYWVLEEYDEEWLTIGGSLFSPRTVPPSRTLVDGWNLIGYYGTSWELYSWGDASFECGDYWEGWPDRYIYGDKVYCALNSLIDTQEGYPRWSSLWSYLNCGGHNAFWLGLNTCADGGIQQQLDRMYAGRGYWIELEGEDQYAPATSCVWNDDFECRWTGGGIIP